MTRTETIKARVTQAELAQVDINAAERKLSRSEYVRRAALDDLEPPAVLVVDEEQIEIVEQPTPDSRLRRLLRRLRR